MPRAARPQQSGTAAAPVSHKAQESIPSSSSGVNVIEQQSSQNLNLSAPAMSEQSSAPESTAPESTAPESTSHENLAPEQQIIHLCMDDMIVLHPSFPGLVTDTSRQELI